MAGSHPKDSLTALPTAPGPLSLHHLLCSARLSIHVRCPEREVRTTAVPRIREWSDWVQSWAVGTRAGRPCCWPKPCLFREGRTVALCLSAVLTRLLSRSECLQTWTPLGRVDGTGKHLVPEGQPRPETCWGKSARGGGGVLLPATLGPT